MTLNTWRLFTSSIMAIRLAGFAASTILTLPPDTLKKDVPPLYEVVKQMIEDSDDDVETDRKNLEEALKNFDATFNPGMTKH